MFEVVQAARRRPWWDRRGTLLGSLGLHAVVLVALAQVAPRETGSVVEVMEQVAFFDVAQTALIRPPDAAARQGDPNEAGEARVPRAAPRTEELLAPAELPVEIPAPSLAAPGSAPELRLAIDSLVSVPTVAQGVRGGAGASDAGSAEDAEEPVLAAMLPKAPRLLNGGEMERLWEQLYPRQLNAAGVEGSAVVLFVIGTDGRVEPSSLTLISSSRGEFGDAALEGARQMRFRPAQLKGRVVRVRATLPVHFLLEA